MSVDDFARFSRALKDAGRKELRKELHKGLRDAAKVLIPEARQALAAALPGGVDSRGERVKQVVLVRTGADPGVTIGMRYGRRGPGLGTANAQLLNREGQLRHPLFGNRQVWRSTAVPGAKGWFDDTYAAGAPRVRPELDAAMQRVVEKILREGG